MTINETVQAINWMTIEKFATHYSLKHAADVSDAARDGAIGIMTEYGFDGSVDEPDEAARGAIQTILEVGFDAGRESVNTLCSKIAETVFHDDVFDHGGLTEATDAVDRELTRLGYPYPDGDDDVTLNGRGQASTLMEHGWLLRNRGAAQEQEDLVADLGVGFIPHAMEVATNKDAATGERIEAVESIIQYLYDYGVRIKSGPGTSYDIEIKS